MATYEIIWAAIKYILYLCMLLCRNILMMLVDFVSSVVLSVSTVAVIVIIIRHYDDIMLFFNR